MWPRTRRNTAEKRPIVDHMFEQLALAEASKGSDPLRTSKKRGSLAGKFAGTRPPRRKRGRVVIQADPSTRGNSAPKLLRSSMLVDRGGIGKFVAFYPNYL